MPDLHPDPQQDWSERHPDAELTPALHNSRTLPSQLTQPRPHLRQLLRLLSRDLPTIQEPNQGSLQETLGPCPWLWLRPFQLLSDGAALQAVNTNSYKSHLLLVKSWGRGNG